MVPPVLMRLRHLHERYAVPVYLVGGFVFLHMAWFKLQQNKKLIPNGTGQHPFTRFWESRKKKAELEAAEESSQTTAA